MENWAGMVCGKRGDRVAMGIAMTVRLMAWILMLLPGRLKGKWSRRRKTELGKIKKWREGLPKDRSEGDRKLSPFPLEVHESLDSLKIGSAQSKGIYVSKPFYKCILTCIERF